MTRDQVDASLPAEAMGISRWHAVATIVLPASWKNILLAMILAVGRAMGETMAVMMVMGNVNLFPRLPGKGESIASVIALEMGTVVVGSTHYHALYAAGLVLMVLGIVLFLFGYVFAQGAAVIGWEFLATAPRGAVPGEGGGIRPAIAGSFAFTLVAVVPGGIPAIDTALFMVFCCRSRRLEGVICLVVQCISGIPSIVPGLFSCSFPVRDPALGRCVLSAGAALGIMVLPFIEVRAEKAFRELLLRLKERYTAVIVTHNLAQARRIADRTVFLYNGRLIEEGSTEQLFTAPEQEETKRFLSGVFG